MGLPIMLGADPEVFMYKDGVPVSAHGAVPGDKENPHVVDKGAVQVDGMALEFNIDPVTSQKAFSDNIKSVLHTLEGMVEGYDVKAEPVANFTAEYLGTQPPCALEFGCDPDYNTYTGEVNPKPPEEALFRTGAGHVHIGWTNDVDPHHPEHFEACRMLVKQLDVYLGLPFGIIDHDRKRRELYGQIGAFRPKPYGVEYRVLSNVWVKQDKLRKFVFKQCKRAVDDLMKGNRLYAKFYPGLIEDLIEDPKDIAPFISKTYNLVENGPARIVDFSDYWWLKNMCDSKIERGLYDV